VELKKNSNFEVSKAVLTDSKGIHDTLLKNLIKIEDFDEISEKEKKKLKNEGFLRKEVEEKYYFDLIKDPGCEIYLAKEETGKIIGFASFHLNKSNIFSVRSTLSNLYVENNADLRLLTDKTTNFIYLDQISVIPSYKRKGIGSAILNEASRILRDNIIAFVVKSPLANKASTEWHKRNGFKSIGTSKGFYKGKTLECWIFLHRYHKE
jgi:ribosomal protein S18 acetylase RimI-like enzyme